MVAIEPKTSVFTQVFASTAAEKVTRSPLRQVDAAPIRTQRNGSTLAPRPLSEIGARQQIGPGRHFRRRGLAVCGKARCIALPVCHAVYATGRFECGVPCIISTMPLASAGRPNSTPAVIAVDITSLA
jgi:hypothetical protein